MARCKFCGQEIDWITSLEGKQVPVDPDPVFVIESDGPEAFLPFIYLRYAVHDTIHQGQVLAVNHLSSLHTGRGS